MRRHMRNLVLQGRDMRRQHLPVVLLCFCLVVLLGACGQDLQNDPTRDVPRVIPDTSPGQIYIVIVVMALDNPAASEGTSGDFIAVNFFHKTDECVEKVAFAREAVTAMEPVAEPCRQISRAASMVVQTRLEEPKKVAQETPPGGSCHCVRKRPAAPSSVLEQSLQILTCRY
jgi:hypothetical protein